MEDSFLSTLVKLVAVSLMTATPILWAFFTKVLPKLMHILHQVDKVNAAVNDRHQKADADGNVPPTMYDVALELKEDMGHVKGHLEDHHDDIKEHKEHMKRLSDQQRKHQREVAKLIVRHERAVIRQETWIGQYKDGQLGTGEKVEAFVNNTNTRLTKCETIGQELKQALEDIDRKLTEHDQWEREERD